MHPELISDAEIQAYLDGELDLDQRLAVETYLSRDAAAAARFVADLRNRTALRLLSGGMGEPSAAMVAAARRLSVKLGSPPARRLRDMFSTRAFQATAAAAMLALIVVPARNALAQPPAYVGAAVEAYRTGLLRAKMDSQVETPVFNASEVQRSTKIRVPRLPAHWVITDAQIFPSSEGPTLQLMVRTPTAQNLSVFAVRMKSSAPAEPETVQREGTSVAYWSEGDMSYALTGGEEPEALDEVADNIAAEAI